MAVGRISREAVLTGSFYKTMYGCSLGQAELTVMTSGSNKEVSLSHPTFYFKAD